MKKYYWFALILLVCIIVVPSTLNAGSSTDAGYSLDPWGTKTWTGPGRPPHWSPEKTQPQSKAIKPSRPVSSGRPVDPGYRVRPPDGSGGHGGYWRDKHSRWHHHSIRRSGYIYYREPKVETVIIERERQLPVYLPVKQEPSTLQCGGRTITSRDPKTGEITIEYVTAAQDC